MFVVRCPACQAIADLDVETCPHCGAALAGAPVYRARRRRLAWWPIALALLLATLSTGRAIAYGDDPMGACLGLPLAALLAWCILEGVRLLALRVRRVRTGERG